MPRPLPWLRTLPALALVALASLVHADAKPPRPASVHVAWLDGRSLEQAMATGAQILDRFPDAVIVSGESSRALLAAAGYRLEGPVALPADGLVTLMRDEGHGTALDETRIARGGGRVLWHGKDNWLVASDQPLADTDALVLHHRQALRERPLARRALPSAERSPATPEVNVTSFAPIIQEMVDQVSGADFIQFIGDFAGKRSVNVGGVPTTFTTRSTPTALCDKAEQYLYERFQALGFTDVAYDPFTFSSTSARNVVATIPGVVHPNRIVILGGHLDSTSPQSSTNAPGANDNASGIAGILQAAAILRNYEFENTIKLIGFTGEEQGLFGSVHYANAAATRGDSILGVVIFDMIGWKNTQNVIDIEGENAWLPLMTVMNDACARYTSIGTNLVFNSFGSDHVPFQDNNFPAFLAIETEYEDYPCYHQTCDTTGWNQVAFGSETVRAGLATVAHMAGPRDFYFTHTALANTENTTGPYEVVADLSILGPLVPDSLLLHWSRGGPELTEVMTPTATPGRYHAYIPGQPSGTLVRYWMSARDVDDRLAFFPDGAPATTIPFLVSGRTAIFSEDFESGAPGWTSGGTVNDWQVATPLGLAEDPSSAFSGTRVAGNDLTGLGVNLGRYEPFCDNWFETPSIDCSQATDVQLTFMRRLATDRSNGGSWDAARILVNNTLIWANPTATALVDNAWTSQTFSIGNIADGVASVKVRFAMRSNASVQYGGWNLDDVKLTAYSTAVTAVGDDLSRGAALLASTPNPGRPGMALRFQLASRADVELAIYDVRGRRVRTLARGEREAGVHTVRWDGRGDRGELGAAGVYFSRLTANGATFSRKLVLVR